jgi:aryl-alcohol dehydrogenase-like predicted oxidoreductase
VTALDTAYNYHRFASHRTLARIAGDLLGRFEISTKVGYFPDGHDLDPARLRQAVEQAAADLGRIPDTVLLHNPEHSPEQVPRAAEILAAARTKDCAAPGASPPGTRSRCSAQRDRYRPRTR